MAAIQIDSADAGLFFISDSDDSLLLAGNILAQNYTLFTVEPETAGAAAETQKEFWE